MVLYRCQSNGVVVPSNRRNEEGRFEADHQVSVSDVFDAMKPLEPYTTAELAELVGAPRRTILKYLDKLAEEGKIRKKKPEPRRAIWIRNE